tara:strand:- start:171 stop:395 length:225 start_codon:yes stop_codon:yes gene_type:complete
MASNKLQLKKSSSAGATPPVSGGSTLLAGEIAINTADKKLYFKDSSGNLKYFVESDEAKQTAIDEAVALSIGLG